jgi:hypothetical protein
VDPLEAEHLQTGDIDDINQTGQTNDRAVVDYGSASDAGTNERSPIASKRNDALEVDESIPG